ncbi:sister chromatid cohesion 1 protein 2-like isoform X3 [Primulina eburnea]|uniref:sister chromatid cohesion 1 protein 2-like isoform X3 n=1 Tax=Primulina eburnea TaxID=1245227 RepID=UPI003C6C39CF
MDSSITHITTLLYFRPDRFLVSLTRTSAGFPTSNGHFYATKKKSFLENTMFYSRLLLSKKGYLGLVWIAAHCPKRLKKDQVWKAEISSYVDKILADEVPIVTHRILAYLLLGVVRIYSMKVEYLLHDCNDVLNKLCEFNIGKRKRPGIGVFRTNYHSITMPKKFELDEFDLEILEDRDITGGNMSSCEDVVLADEQIKVGASLSLLDKENVSFPETHSTTYTPPRDVFLPPTMDNDNDLLMNSFRDPGDFVTSVEKLRETNFLLEDLLNPTVLNGSEKKQLHYTLPNEHPRTNFQWLGHEMKCDSVATPSHDISDMVSCMENLQENRFSLEDRLDPLVLDEAEERQIHFRPYNKDLRTNFRAPIQYSECAMIAKPSHTKPGIEEEHVEHLRIEFNLQEDEPCALPRSIDIGQPVEADKKKKVEVITPEIRKSQRNQEQMKPTTVDVTPNSELSEVDTAEVATIHTPAPKEHAKNLKKRKILLDLTTTLPSKVLKSWIDDPNDIVHKRRKVPHTLLHAWRANKLCHIPLCFLDPLIHSEFTSSFGPITDVVSEDNVNSGSIIGIQEQIQDERSPLTPVSREQTPIAPGTPVAHLNNLRSHEIRAVADSDILEPTSSRESLEQQPLEFIIAFPDEERNSYEGDYLENDVYSAITRAVGIFLYKNFHYKKRREEEDEVLNLTHLLRGKAKKNSARLFYEILVLKTGDCINVRQDKAYDDIMLQEVPKLKQIAETNVV